MLTLLRCVVLCGVCLHVVGNEVATAEAMTDLLAKATLLTAMQDREGADKAWSEALALVEPLPAFKKGPIIAEIYMRIGLALQGQHMVEDALEHYAIAAKHNPLSHQVYCNTGTLYQSIGNTAKALEYFDKALKLEPNDIITVFARSFIVPASPKEMSKQLAVLRATQESNTARPMIYFTLSATCDKLGNYESAWRYLSKANAAALKMQLLAGNGGKEGLHNHDILSQVLTPELIEYLRNEINGMRKPEEQPFEIVPVFIVGMPRSGSTLLEMILSTHPSVRSGGENHDLGDVLSTVIKSPPEHFAARLFEAGQMYMSKIRQRIKSGGVVVKNKHSGTIPDPVFFVDKTLSNYELLPLINLALPTAKIFHTVRHPMACTFSIFKQYFHTGHVYSYKLETLASQYNGYRMLMQQWQTLLPRFVYDVRYEDVILRSNSTIHAVMKHLGLVPPPKWRQFHKSEASIATASFAQARRPLYNASMDAWKRYSHKLGTLQKLLAPYIAKWEATESQEPEEPLEDPEEENSIDSDEDSGEDPYDEVGEKEDEVDTQEPEEEHEEL